MSKLGLYLVVAIVVVFVGYWMVNDPGSLAAFAQEAGTLVLDIGEQLASSVITFLDSLFG